MNQHLQTILNFIQQSEHLSAEERTALSKAAHDADKELEITSFKLSRTEKVKKITAILLEETIEELEQKRKAVEAQNRELEIESSLERVRSKAMAMQKSEDLANAVAIVFEELDKLNMGMLRCGIGILNKENRSVNVWAATTSDKNMPVQISGDESMDSHPLLQGAFDAWLKQEDYSYVLQGEDLTNYYKAQVSANFKLPDSQSLVIGNEGLRQYYFLATFQAGGLFAFRETTFPDEAKKVMKRFADVFNLTYTRFNDLKQAEAQTKEAQIELALERVRSRTMAMQKSDEVMDVAVTLYDELQKLDFKFGASTIIIMDKDSGNMEYWVSGFTQKKYPESYHVDYFKHPCHDAELAAWRNGKKYLVYNLCGKDKKLYDEELFTNTGYKNFPEEEKKWMREAESIIFSLAFMKHGALHWGPTNLSEEQSNILQRFANVFEQSYTRFLDLQKAEAQSREVQIELALERVRARTMAMQKSNELQDTAILLFQQMKALGVQTGSCGFNIWNKDEKAATVWMSSAEGGLQAPFKMPHTESAIYKNVYAAMKNGETFLVKEVGGKALEKHFDYLLSLPGIGDVIKHLRETGYTFPENMVYHFAFFNNGYLSFHTHEPYPEAHDIFKRFAKVFEQTYTRFLDLQKAEAQAREAKIEAALERVRSRTMGMQKSEELKEVIRVVYEQFVHLNILIEHTGFIMDYKTRDDMHIWLADKHEVPAQVTIPYFDCAHWNSFNEAKEKGMDFFANHLSFEEKNKFYQDLFKLIPGLPEEAKEYYFSCPGLAISTVLLENVGLYIENFSAIPYSDEENATLMRFGKVFQQTYTRFLDLQKAEAQAREAKIEAALERVRSRTMAMQQSEELAEVATVLFQQVKALGVPQWVCGFSIWEIGDKEFTWYPGSPDGDILPPCKVPLTEHPVFISYNESRKRGDELFVYEKEGEFQADHYRYMMSLAGMRELMQNMLDAGLSIPTFQIDHIANFSHGNLVFITYEHFPEMHDVFKRFAKVFEQTYTRFLDLQKAEAQAREAKIEAALEKVRSRALAMQKPNELIEVAQLLRREMNLLGVEELETSSIYIHHEETGKTECWYAIKDVKHPEKELVSDHMTIDLNETEVGRKMLAFYHSDKKQISIPMQGANRKEWINYCADHSKVLVGFYGDNIPDRTYHLYKFSNGYMGAASPGDISTESWDLLQRATSVFSLAYTRFSDLQQAEAQAREAKIEVALERVRSRTLAMQKSDELAETAAVLFKQLILLGIEPNRLYINIIKDETGEAEFWITDEDGSKVSSAFESNMNDNQSFKKMYKGWKEKKKSLMIDMKGKELQTYFQHLGSLHVPFKDGLMQKRRLQYIAYFNKGFIGMASPDEQPYETMLLLERFAAVFNLTFTRFNDLKIAEAHAIQAEEDLIKLQTEKKRAEDALSELRATQKQLIQSEKMASLGELTAGIAHEIQNPLNFVNNFSEVNNELIEEMKIELANGNKQEAMMIADDIKENEQKINHHGKRADAIVKGMLQHSRQTSGIKEPTDINALCDEYIRLCYHGLRAKDKSFNADFKTDFDETLSADEAGIGKINIVPQDVGRVLLNLFNNAFYAVNEKSKNPEGFKNLRGLETYKPTISIQTKKINNKIEITVKDNGNGIPQNIIDKIFQPFFTTKPTGQGTGLGLSLAYDIIKAHGGEIKVETKEGGGSEFIIQLPM